MRLPLILFIIIASVKVWGQTVTPIAFDHKLNNNYWAYSVAVTANLYSLWNPPKPLTTTLSFGEDSSDCATSLTNAVALKESSQEQEAYDAFRKYIESCAYLSNSWQIFQQVGEMNGDRNTDFNRFEEYREWLKKVLYYNIDTDYFCADVSEIFTTFSWYNDQRGHDIRGALALDYFLVNTNRCPNLTAYLDSGLKQTWNSLYIAWLDTVRNQNLTPFDSTLPSLEDLDLGILRGPYSDVKKFFDSKYGAIIDNIVTIENPFSAETKIEFICREAVAIRFEVYDILGRKLYDEGNKVYEEGENQIEVPGNNLPHGELFARFSASNGTVKTIQLQHY